MAGAERATGSSSEQGRTALVVTGMHRSGTSAMARVLSLAGGALPERIMLPGPDNPLGFWEPWEMVALNDEILAAVDSRWDNVFCHHDGAAAWEVRERFTEAARDFLRQNYAHRDLPVLKDPRASLMARFWNDALSAEGFAPVHVVMVRHPLEVARSIAARDGSSEIKSMLVWTSYMLAVERDTRDVARVFVTYEQLLEDPQGTLDRIESVVGRSFPDRTPGRTQEIAAFLSDAHRHHHNDSADLQDRADVWWGVGRTYRWMRATAEGRPANVSDLAEVESALDALQAAVGPALADLRRDLATFPTLRAERDEALKENTALRELCNDFHAQADHNGRFLEAARDQLAHAQHELTITRAEAARARSENATLLAVRNDLAQAEIRTIQQQVRNQALAEALSLSERHLASQARLTADLSGSLSAADIALTECRISLEAARTDMETHRAQEAETYNRVVAAARQAQAERAALEHEMGRLAEQAARHETALEETRAQLLEADRKLVIAERERDHHRAALADLKTSLSWRLTRPLRVVTKRLGSRHVRFRPDVI